MLHIIISHTILTLRNRNCIATNLIVICRPPTLTDRCEDAELIVIPFTKQQTTIFFTNIKDTKHCLLLERKLLGFVPSLPSKTVLYIVCVYIFQTVSATTVVLVVLVSYNAFPMPRRCRITEAF